ILLEQMWIIVIVIKGFRIIAKEKITNLLVIPDQGSLLIAAYLMHRLSGLPLHIHMTDFWEEMLCDRIRKIAAKLFEKRIFKSANKISVINDYLKNYYMGKYHVRAELIPNSVILEDYKNATPIDLNTDGNKSIIYTGNVWIPQISSLVDMCTVVNSLEGIKFLVYTDRSSTELKQKGIYGKNVLVRFARPSEIPAIQKTADILYLPLAFDTPFPTYIDSVSPSKMPEYMAAGKPILVYAPKTSYIANYAKQHGFACVVKERSHDELKEALLTLLKDKRVREETVKKSKILVMQFDTISVSSKLQEILKYQVVS
ncbi:MAG: glycosyltransferase, partial [Thermodesulfobacteriota bacterium]